MTAATPFRIAPLEPPYEPGVERYLVRMMPPDSGLDPLKLFRTLAVHVDLASRMRPLGSGLLTHPTIEPREREIVILRTCALAGAEYEWGVHATFFDELSDEEVRGTAPSQAHDWGEKDALLVRLADELHATSCITDELWEGLRRHWSDEQLIELIVLAGWYRTISYLVNALRIELEQWAARLP